MSRASLDAPEDLLKQARRQVAHGTRRGRWAPDVSICRHWRTARRAVPRRMACVQPVYRPRNAEHSVLHQVIREHLEAFLREAAEAGQGVGLPQFVEREFREFLTCGAFEGGFARFRGEGCAREHLVPFSCKGQIGRAHV